MVQESQISFKPLSRSNSLELSPNFNQLNRKQLTYYWRTVRPIFIASILGPWALTLVHTIQCLGGVTYDIIYRNADTDIDADIDVDTDTNKKTKNINLGNFSHQEKCNQNNNINEINNEVGNNPNEISITNEKKISMIVNEFSRASQQQQESCCSCSSSPSTELSSYSSSSTSFTRKESSSSVSSSLLTSLPTSNITTALSSTTTILSDELTENEEEILLKTSSSSNSNSTYKIKVAYPWLRFFFEISAFLGTEEFYMCFLPTLLWCYEVHTARQCILFWSILVYIGNYVKDLLELPRPLVLPVVCLEREHSLEYGFPSVHTIGAFTTLYACYQIFVQQANDIDIEKGPTWWHICILSWIVVASLIMVSRLYLGVHGVHDLCGGLFFGGIWFCLATTSFPFLKIQSSLLESDELNTLPSRMLDSDMTIIEYLDTIFMVHPYGGIGIILFYFSLALIHPLPTKFTPTLEYTCAILGSACGVFIGCRLLYNISFFASSSLSYLSNSNYENDHFFDRSLNESCNEPMELSLGGQCKMNYDNNNNNMEKTMQDIVQTILFRFIFGLMAVVVSKEASKLALKLVFKGFTEKWILPFFRVNDIPIQIERKRSIRLVNLPTASDNYDAKERINNKEPSLAQVHSFSSFSNKSNNSSTQSLATLVATTTTANTLLSARNHRSTADMGTNEMLGEGIPYEENKGINSENTSNEYGVVPNGSNIKLKDPLTNSLDKKSESPRQRRRGTETYDEQDTNEKRDFLQEQHFSLKSEFDENITTGENESMEALGDPMKNYGIIETFSIDGSIKYIHSSIMAAHFHRFFMYFHKLLNYIFLGVSIPLFSPILWAYVQKTYESFSTSSP